MTGTYAPCQTIALTGSDGAHRAAATLLAGFVIQETGGASAATIRVYDNASAASGTLVAAANLAAGGSSTVAFFRPINCVNGLYVDVGGSGVIAGSLLIA